YLEHLGLIPRHVTDPSLHRSHAAGLTLQGDRFDGFAFEGAELPYHIPQDMVPRLASPKAWSEGRVKYPKFVEEPLDVTDADIELRQCVGVSRGATRR